MTSREYYWNPKNTEKYRAYARNYHNLHKEECNRKTKAWRNTNRQHVLAYKRNYYTNNPSGYSFNKEKINNHRREYRRKNWKLFIEKERLWHNKWKLAHPEKMKEYRIDYSHRRRVDLSKDKCSVTTQDLREIKLTFKKCPFCDKPATTFEHIYPLQPHNKNVKQGTHIKENIIRTCVSCNSSKNNKDPIEWCKEQKIKIPEIITERIKILQDGD